MKKIFIAGSSGKIGQLLVSNLRDKYKLVLGDIAPKDSDTHEIDLMKPDSYANLFEGVDCLIHLAGVCDEIPEWQRTLEVNVIGSAHIFEAARVAGVKRIIYASSVQAVGYYPRAQELTTLTSARPDNMYGVSKAAVEAMAHLYADKYGISCICLRIHSLEEKPITPRHLTTWLSQSDALRLLRASIEAKNIHYAILNGVSKNTQRKAFNGGSHVPFSPKDNAEDFRGQIHEKESSFAALFHGGSYCEDGFCGNLDEVLRT